MREEHSCGAIAVLRGQEDKFLLVQLHDGYWGFPKGHREVGETLIQTALRELKEETGITKCEILNMPPISQEYTFTDRETPCHKVVDFFVGFVTNDIVSIQTEEILDHRWVTFGEAIELLSFTSSKEVLKKATHYLKS